ncbi:polyprenol monophosphomannose synthase [bacterium]|nr:polyprenol monophosphomannose synthase [bacterium]
MPNKRALIVIPTYNEKDNLPILIERIFKIDLSVYVSELHLLVVDDNSPDGTAELVRTLQKSDSRIHLLLRSEKQGLGKAYVAGFDYALQNSYDYIFEMDADLSHDPNYLPDFLNRIQHCDLVIGSRYVKGVNVINWPLSRLLISYFGNKYARWVTGMPIQDSTAGYKCFKRETLQSIDLTRVSASGYSFQIEMNYRAWILKFKICEIPIIFYDRTIGASKMSTNIIREGFLLVWKLKIRNFFGKL